MLLQHSNSTVKVLLLHDSTNIFKSYKFNIFIFSAGMNTVKIYGARIRFRVGLTYP